MKDPTSEDWEVLALRSSLALLDEFVGGHPEPIPEEVRYRITTPDCAGYLYLPEGGPPRLFTGWSNEMEEAVSHRLPGDRWWFLSRKTGIRSA